MAWQEADAPVDLLNSTALHSISAMWQSYPLPAGGQLSRLVVSQGLGYGISTYQCLHSDFFHIPKKGLKISNILLKHCNMIVKVRHYKICSTICQHVICTFFLFYLINLLILITIFQIAFKIISAYEEKTLAFTKAMIYGIASI